MTAAVVEALGTLHTCYWVSAEAPATTGTIVCWVTSVSDVGIETAPQLI